MIIDDQVQYGGFGRRLVSNLIDVAIFIPLTFMYVYLSDQYKHLPLYWMAPSVLVGLYYNVYLVKRYGGTPGKLIMRMRIRPLEGVSLTYRQALLRHGPAFLFSIVLSVGLIQAVLAMPDSLFHELSRTERNRYLFESGPSWMRGVNVANQVWFWGELVVLLTNKKRRALHDFLAGTVVTVESPNQAL